jgi:hypothetical protein
MLRGDFCRLPIPDHDTLQRQIFTLFGEPDVDVGCYHFVEAPKGYDGTLASCLKELHTVYGFNSFLLIEPGISAPFFVASSNFSPQPGCAQGRTQ